MRSPFVFLTLFVVFVLFLPVRVSAQNAAIPVVPPKEELQRPFSEKDLEIFRKPPNRYRPETWFHYIGGNVSQKGITADLEAIAAAGISGVQLFHGQFGGPWPGVEPQIPCLSEDWDAAVKFTAEECKRLNLRFTMQNCPGWAMSGGPWIEPANAMRHLVLSRMDLENELTENDSVTLSRGQPSDEPWRDYRDIVVLAFPSPLDDTNAHLKPVLVKSNRENLDELWGKCVSDYTHGQLRLPPAGDENPNVVEITFAENVTLRTVEFSSVNGFLHAFCYEPGIDVTLETVSPQGVAAKVFQLEMPQASWQDDRPISFACDETTAKVFRFTIHNRHEMMLNSLHLFSAARKNNWESEAGWTLRSIVREGENPNQSPQAFVDFEKIIDISDKMDSEGVLRWNKPAGKWTVLRFGHVNTGMRNGPAPPEGTGWECDKLSRTGPEVHFAGYIGRLCGEDGPLENGLLGGMLLDSWECKTQTWTADLDRTFKDKTGYELQKYLPTVFGYVISDHETSKRFLRDWRGVIGDLFANEFYGRMAELAKENGLAIQYETAAGDIFPADILEYYKYADVPMCEFWQPLSHGFVGSLNFKPIKPTASAARIYGKPRVSAEAFTSFALTWDEHWEMLKETFNLNASEGVTHCIFHTYTHNPRTDFLPPGTSFGSGIGTPFLRGQTWWKHTPEFTDYLARCCFLLERGKPVSDVLWYLGDEIDHKPNQEFSFPKGFKYDYCNSDVLLNRLSVENGDLVTPEGVRYRMLWMPNCKRMLPETLEKIRDLVRDGATVIGKAPEGLATLSGGEQAQRRFDAAVKELWQNSKKLDFLQCGKGRVLNCDNIHEAISALQLSPDLELANGDVEPLWLHRRVEGSDWYFLAAPPSQEVHAELLFRTEGNCAELWNPVTGKVSPLHSTKEDGRTCVTVNIPKAGAIFVVFHEEKRDDTEPQPVKYVQKEQLPLKNPWTLAFPEGWGTPQSLEIAELKAWKDLDVSEEAKAFSGTVRYSTKMTLDAVSPDCRYMLDLGQVEFIAAVSVNGKNAGTLWANPYCIDVTEFLQKGANTLTIDVTSTWFNRLVYDAAQEESNRKTWTISGPGKDNPLRASGLLGPVKLRVEELQK